MEKILKKALAHEQALNEQLRERVLELETENKMLQLKLAAKYAGTSMTTNPRIPKSHPLLPYSANVMLRDCRQMVARELRRQRKIRRLKGENKS